MVTLAEMFAQAKAYHRAGQLQLAEPMYRQVLQADPTHAEALYLLGALYQSLGRLTEAAACLQPAVRLMPNRADAHNHLGVVLAQQGKLGDAIVAFEQALRLQPVFPDAANNLRQALARRGAVATPETAEARQARERSAQACQEQGVALLQQEKLAEAQASFQQALQYRPDFAEAHSNLGVAFARQEKLEEAANCFRRALQVRPDYTEALCNLGIMLLQQGNLPEAAANFQQAIRLRPEDAEPYVQLARALRQQGKLEEAVDCCRRALALRPDHAGAHNSLGTALSDQGKQQEAMACYGRVLELQPESSTLHSNYLFSHQHRLAVTPAELASLHAEWDRRHAAPLQSCWKPHDNVRDPARRLQLGFVSADFRRHALAYIFVRALEALDRQQCHTVCYSNQQVQDDMTARIRGAADVWRQSHDMSDEALAQQIRSDGVDILFDLDGHTGGNRLAVFARKPAPVQITWLGSACTTGLSAMDYLLADRWQVPDGAEAHYREQVLRLPDGYYCYDPPEYAPQPGPLPALQQRYVTFACFNKPEKINRSVVATWAAILRRIPTARLVLKYHGFGDPGTCRYFTEMFAAEGLSRDRLELQGYSSHQELLHQYNRVDIALDPFTFSGCVTTCEALWMGVPVITCPGDTFASRHSLSHLSNVGLTDMVARDLPHYVELAVALAQDLPRLAALRAALRPQMARSPLCDAPRFAVNLMQSLRHVWQQWCSEQTSTAVSGR
jgi:protein O-GlcNAc transferase